MRRTAHLHLNADICIRSGRPASRGFTLVELLVVISIIALLIAILLPSLGAARKSAMQIQCLSQHRQIGIAVMCYSSDHDQVLPPMQAKKVNVITGTGLVEYSWRGLLYDYVQDFAVAYDCPAEEIDRYSNGAVDDRGRPTPTETYIASGLGAADVHWNSWNGNGNFRPAFGRHKIATGEPSATAYQNSANPVLKLDQIEDTTQLIMVGDGHSSSTSTPYRYPEDAFWIYRWTGNRFDPGFDRSFQDDPGDDSIGDEGLERHGNDGDANYLFSDGHAEMLNAKDIPCTLEACWWDARKDAH